MSHRKKKSLTWKNSFFVTVFLLLLSLSTYRANHSFVNFACFRCTITHHISIFDAKIPPFCLFRFGIKDHLYRCVCVCVLYCPRIFAFREIDFRRSIIRFSALKAIDEWKTVFLTVIFSNGLFRAVIDLLLFATFKRETHPTWLQIFNETIWRKTAVLCPLDPNYSFP